MLAAQLVGPRQIKMAEVPKPVCGKNSVLVKIKYTAICGTDLHTWRDANVALPRIMGHEIVGVIAEKGALVTKHQVGERVVLNQSYACGECDLCDEAKAYLCKRGGLLGRDADGGYTEYIVVSEPDAFKIPDSVPFAEATQIQTLSTVYHGQKRLQMESGRSAMVVGMGVTGFLHLQLAKATGATPVIAVDTFPWKLELAKRLGADEVLQVPDEKAVEKITALTGGKGPHAVIEAVGIPPTVSLAIQSVAPGGKVLMFGIGHQPLTGFDPYAIYFKEINLIGCRASGRADWPPSIALVKSGAINLKPLVTHIMPLTETAKGFELMDKNAQGLIRVAIEMPE
jgi:2-desacetyl-2-hydroxyethyl bacteriochlorophyllide A dehydrogenase